MLHWIQFLKKCGKNVTVIKIKNKRKLYNIYKHMNYRDYYKKNTKNVKSILAEGVDVEQLKKGIRAESKNTDDVGFAAKIAIRHLNEDANYYNRLAEQDDNTDCEDNNCNCGAQKSGEHNPHADTCNVYKNESAEIDIPTLDGATAIPHRGQAIHLSKIIQVGGLNKSNATSTATGELSGYTSVNSPGDKETLTAGGKKVDSSIATKTVGGEVSPGEGQKQEGPNHGGTIAGTKAINESKIRDTIKNLLKEIKFDKNTKKWVRIDEASYKVVPQTLARVNNGKDQHARIVQYEPNITEDSDDALSSFAAERDAMDKFDSENPTLAHRRKSLAPSDKYLADPEDAEDYVGKKLADKGKDFLSQVHADISKKDPSWRKDDEEKSDEDDSFDNTTFRGKKEKPPLQRDPELAKVLGKNNSADIDDDDEAVDEAGVGAVQHKSFRTVNDAPQDPKNRFDPELSEATEQPKASETAKQIKKSAKGGKVNKSNDFKYKQKSSKTAKSGVKKEN